MGFKVGDKVKVKEELVIGSRYDGGCYFDKEMDRYRGKTCTIMHSSLPDPKERYAIDCDNGKWSWSPSMLEPAKEEAKFKVGDKVVPISKGVLGPLSLSSTWIRAQEKNQPFLYVTALNPFYGEIGLHDDKKNLGFDCFLESDLIPYVEKKTTTESIAYHINHKKRRDRLHPARQVQRYCSLQPQRHFRRGQG